MLPRSPSSFTPLPDGRYLMIGHDKAMTHREVSKFSKKDADNLPKFEAMLERVASFLEPMLIETPPNPWSVAPGNLIKLAKTAWNFRKLGVDGQKAIEILTGAANPILDRWLESEEVKTTISTDAIIGALPLLPCRARPTFSSITSWASATACAAFGAMSEADMGALPTPSRLPPKNAAPKSKSTRPCHASWLKMAAPGVALPMARSSATESSPA
jgi:phytoene dehydrogenase-like protein